MYNIKKKVTQNTISGQMRRHDKDGDGNIGKE